LIKNPWEALEVHISKSKHIISKLNIKERERERERETNSQIAPTDVVGILRAY
jgi:hypothetical protein